LLRASLARRYVKQPTLFVTTGESFSESLAAAWIAGS
jgi:hypothetical protein